MNTSDSLPKTLVCPKCGWRVEGEVGKQGGMIIAIDDYVGNHCLKCWSKWLKNNVPKLEESKILIK